MIDLTKITTPFDLLDAETQEALKAHGGPYEWWHGVGWFESKRCPAWDVHFVHRVKPAPPKPREWLLAGDGKSLHVVYAPLSAKYDEVIRVIEVLP